jgi:hypothetical protein
MNGYHTVFIVSATIVLIGAFVAYYMGNVNLRSDEKVHVEV